MKCNACGERDGVVSLTQIVEGDVRTVSLCAKCAAEKGIETGIGLAETPLGGFLAALGESADPDAPLAAALEAGCSSCGATLRDFRETGRVGCAECYRAFDAPLRELLRRLHGSTHHTGMRYQGSETAPVTPPEEGGARELRDQLRRAIEAEHFELAAEIRDRLRERE
jgi:protein arginine kinase activator